MNLAKFLPFPFSQAELDAEIRNLCDGLEKAIQPRTIYVFGSAVTGDRHAASDIDLAVIVALPDQIKNALRMAAKLASNRLLPVDIVVFDQATFLHRRNLGGICQTIQEEGRLFSGEDIRE